MRVISNKCCWLLLLSEKPIKALTTAQKKSAIKNIKEQNFVSSWLLILPSPKNHLDLHTRSYYCWYFVTCSSSSYFVNCSRLQHTNLPLFSVGTDTIHDDTISFLCNVTKRKRRREIIIWSKIKCCIECIFRFGFSFSFILCLVSVVWKLKHSRGFGWERSRRSLCLFICLFVIKLLNDTCTRNCWMRFAFLLWFFLLWRKLKFFHISFGR